MRGIDLASEKLLDNLIAINAELIELRNIIVRFGGFCLVYCDCPALTRRG